MTTLTKADLEKLVDDLTAENTALKAAQTENLGDPEGLAAKDKEIAEAKGLAVSLQEDNTKLRDEIDKLKDRVSELTSAGNASADETGKERERADKAERALSEQREELSQLRTDNGQLRGKLERALVSASTLHGHIDDLKAPY